MAPEATRAPPTVSTAKNDICTASPAVLPASADHFAALTPARHAEMAALRMRSSSRASAPDAFTVRMAPNMRSITAPMAPTDSCAARAARLMRGTTRTMIAAARMSTERVTASSRASTNAIKASVARRVRLPVMAETRDCVATDRTSVVSAVTRDMRSPGSMFSTAATHRRTSREISRSRAESTIDSPVRSRT